MFRVQTDHSLDALLPHISKTLKTEANAIKAAHKFMHDNPQDGVIVVTNALHEPIVFVVRDTDLTGGDVKEISPIEWESI